MADLTLEQRRAIAVAEAKVAMGRERVSTPPAREPSFLDRHGRSMSKAAGGIIGGALAAPAALASAPSLVGPVAIEAGAIGIGSAIGGQVYDLATQKRQALVDQLKTIGGDFLENAPWAMAGPIAGAAIKPTATRIASFLNAGKTAKSTAAQSEAALIAARDAGVQRLQQAKTAAEATRTRQATLAATLTKRGETAQAASVPPKPRIGNRAQLSDIGDVVRTPAKANEVAINAQMKQADETYRTAMNQVAADRAAIGIGASDTNAAKEQIKQSRKMVYPDPVTRPSVGFVPADSAGAKLHKMALEVLEPKKIPLTEAQAIQLRKQGVKLVVEEGQTYRIIKPKIKDVDDFRRFVGEVTKGKIEGYGAVNIIEAKNIYNNFSKIIDELSKGASASVQANWKAGKDALKPFEKVKAGKTLVGTQKGTDVEMVPASAIPGRMIGGGRDTFQQTTAVAGPEATSQALRSTVQNKLLDASGNPVTAAKANELLAPGTELSDIVSRDPALSAEVRRYITQLQDAEMAGVRATEFGKRATTAQAASSAAQTERATLAAELRGLKSETNLSKAFTTTDAIVMRLAKNEKITPAQQQSYLDIKATADAAIKAAKTAAEKKAVQDSFVRKVGITIGAGAAGVKALDIVFGDN